jgi:hypothetical protein
VAGIFQREGAAKLKRLLAFTLGSGRLARRREVGRSTALS